MTALTLEIIHNGGKVESLLPLVAHVHKRMEMFRYNDQVVGGAVPLNYLENRPIDSWRNIQIANRTYGVPSNAPRVLSRRLGWEEFRGTTYTSSYGEISLTNQSTVDQDGVRRPLWWRHILPADTIECSLYSIESGNRHDTDSGFERDLVAGVLYTNYENFHNQDTGAYRVWFVASTDKNGKSTNELLNPQPVIRESDWEDIDLETGELKGGRAIYSREQTTSGYTFNLSEYSTYWAKPVSRSLIQPVRSTGRDPDESWYLKFTNGDFTALVDGDLHRYWIPEYHNQPFFPYKPIVYSPYRKMLWVNQNLLVATRKNIAIKPSQNLHFTLQIFDQDGELIRVLTTDGTLHGTRYSNTSVVIESDKIHSWDNQNGFVALGIGLLPSWTFKSSYFYEADDLEYTGLSLNPLENKKVGDYLYCFYIVPDAPQQSQAIHHLAVDRSGRIAEVSQSSLKVRIGSTYNPNTVVGMLYSDWLESHTVGYGNLFSYYVLAEVSFADSELIENQFLVDVRRDGAVIVRDNFEEAIRANPKILQSVLGYGPDGQEVPRNAVMAIRAPITLLEEYGGPLTEHQAGQLIRTYLNSTTYGLIDWEYPASSLTGVSLVAGEVELEWTWEGPDLTYRLYSRSSPTEPWVLLTSIVDPVEGTVQYSEVATSNLTRHYKVAIWDGLIEYPAGNSLLVKVL